MNKDSYNKIALQWAAVRNDAFVSELVKDFADRITSQGHVLDIGCGTGFPLANYLIDRHFSLTGIDASGQMIALAQASSIANAEFIHSDFFAFTSPVKFDGILAWDSLWHFPKEKQESIYPKIGSLLKRNGYLLFTHGNVSDEHMDTMMGESFYYSSLAKDRVYALLKDSGFTVEYAHENFVEQNTDKGFVVLARKTNE